MNQELTVSKTVTDNGVEFQVEGRINTTNAGILEQALENAIQDGHINIVLNMRMVTFLTSVGIRLILKTHKKCTEAGGKFQIQDPSRSVKNVLRLSALHQIFVD